jgi:hypothetical protein
MDDGAPLGGAGAGSLGSDTVAMVVAQRRGMKEMGMGRRAIGVVVLVVAVAGLFGMGQRAELSAQEATPMASGHPLVGSWNVTIAFEGTSTVKLPSLITYTAEGTVLVANAGQLPLSLSPASGLFFTEGHGTWRATGERTADATFVFLILDQTTGLAATSTTRTSVAVDASGNAYTGRFESDTISPSGNSMGSERGTVQATRIQVQPLGGQGVATPVAATPTA